MYMAATSGPTILWGELKGKKVKSNDGKDLGGISKISQNHIRVEKGLVKKEKFWIPKYLADAFDGKVLWLLAGEEEIKNKFHYGEEPLAEQYERDYNTFKNSSYGQNRNSNIEKVNVIQERTFGVPNEPVVPEKGYKNVRELK
jgi:hypothetical protein